jgi:hypothetical protein
MSAPLGFMYAWHVRRQVRNWKTTLAFYWGLVIGTLVGVVFVCGTIAMTMHYVS